MKYFVKNKAKDNRKFRDRFTGKDVIVRPGETVSTSRPPQKNEIWEVSNIEKLEKKDLITEKEVIRK